MKLLLYFKQKILLILALALILFASIYGSIFYSYEHILTTSSTDLLSGNIAFIDSTRLLLHVTFERSNESSFIGSLSCTFLDKQINGNVTLQRNSYSVVTTISAGDLQEATFITCTGKETTQERAITKLFSPYGIIDGGVTLENPKQMTDIDLHFHKLDGVLFSGKLDCFINNKEYTSSEKGVQNYFTILIKIPTQEFSNGAKISCNGEQFTQSNKSSKIIASGSYTPYIQIHGGISINNSKEDIAVYFYKENNSIFHGFLDCRSSSIHLQSSGTTNELYVHKEYTISSLSQSPMECTGITIDKNLNPIISNEATFTPPITSSYTNSLQIDLRNTNHIFSPKSNIPFTVQLSQQNDNKIPLQVSCMDDEGIPIEEDKTIPPQTNPTILSFTFRSQINPPHNSFIVKSIICKPIPQEQNQELIGTSILSYIIFNQ